MNEPVNGTPVLKPTAEKQREQSQPHPLNVKDLPGSIAEKVCAFTLNAPERGRCLELKCAQFNPFFREDGTVIGGNCSIPLTAAGIHRLQEGFTQMSQELASLNANIRQLAFARGGHRG